ncbi:DNA polymerase delta subunit 3 [Gryganskiella cystojenkinii]|nr:DNA polymerase delta subunit 3 [Gryganskiella cystojenkinii]
MPTDIENQTIELLIATVEDEKKPVTYRWLSRSMGYSVNVAKQLMDSYLESAGKGKVHGTYYVARQDSETGNRVLSLVSQDKVQEAKKAPGFIGCHIYSLEPSQLADRAILSVNNAEATQLQQGKDINQYRFVQNHEVVISKANTARPAPSKSATAAPTKPAASGLGGLSGTRPGLASTSSPAASNTKAKPATAPASKGVSSFFGKSAASKPLATPPASSSPSPAITSTAKAVPPKSSTLNFKPVQKRKAGDSDDEEVDSEEERDRRLAQSSRQGEMNGSDNTVATQPETIDVDAIKKKQRSARRLAVEDDEDEDEDEDELKGPKGRRSLNQSLEDEDEIMMSKEARIAHDKEKEAQRLALENMMLIDDNAAVVVEDDDEPMIDVEAVDAPAPVAPRVVVPKPSITREEIRIREDGVRVRRVRGTRIVTKRKTSKNERGYMVTEDVLEKEDFSEDELVKDDVPTPAPAPPVKAPAEPSSKSAPGPKKKAAGSGNQSLLNFFSKK